jgi:hypothetical protein
MKLHFQFHLFSWYQQKVKFLGQCLRSGGKSCKLLSGVHGQSKTYHGRKSGQSTTKEIIERVNGEKIPLERIDIEDFSRGGGGSFSN